MPIFMGIDAGTTNVKVVLADENRTILASASEATRIHAPFDGAREMDMDELWDVVCRLALDVRDLAPDAFNQIEGVGVSAQGDGMWPIGADGKPVGNAVLWNDLRTRELTGIDEQALDRLLIDHSSTALFSGASPLILKWISEKEPERFALIHKAVRCKDWLNYKLTGDLASDFTDHSTCGINIFTRKHLPEIYDFLDIPGAAEMLPCLISSTDITGRVSAEASSRCAIAAGTPVIAGALDLAAVSFGAGLTKKDDGCVILGTTLCSYILLGKEQVDVTARAGSTLCSILPDRYVRLMASLSGSTAVDWAKSVLAPELSFAELEVELKKVPPGSRGVLYHPYISGERAPFRNPFACGGFYGLTSSHNRFDMLRAAYEGMALSLLDCHRALPETDGQIYIAGGGAVSGFTCNLVASALGRRVTRTNCRELAALGIIDAVKLGLGYEIQTEACADADLFLPDPELTELYGSMLSRFTTMRGRMEPYWNERAGD